MLLVLVLGRCSLSLDPCIVSHIGVYHIGGTHVRVGNFYALVERYTVVEVSIIIAYKELLTAIWSLFCGGC